MDFSDAPNKNAIFVGLRQINHLTILIGSKPIWLAGISEFFRDSLTQMAAFGLPEGEFQKIHAWIFKTQINYLMILIGDKPSVAYKNL